MVHEKNGKQNSKTSTGIPVSYQEEWSTKKKHGKLILEMQYMIA